MGEKLKNYSYDKAFSQAIAFNDVALMCEKEPNVFKDTRTEFHSVAGMVNSCFACELFIKTILIFKGKQEEAKGHGLHDLWEKLKKIDVDLTGKIEDSVNSLFKYKINSFDNLLKICNNSFVELRYIYEYENIGFCASFIYLFRRILYEECNIIIK